ncbi:MAG: FHA domain-containing protein [Planctomycetaceae bacterium]|nr:FHA domain-containing protein [Planctomycetaceae bacterium]
MYIELEVSNKRSNVKRLVIRDRAIIGRQSHCDIRVVSSELSREHCRIDLDGKDAQLTDLGSTNGTYLNRKKLEGHQAYPIRNGDLIQLGPAAFCVHLKEVDKVTASLETLSGVSQETISGESGFSSVPVDLVSDDESTVPADELMADLSAEQAEFSEEEFDEILPDDDETTSLLAGVASDAELNTVDDDDAYDRFLKDL